MILLRHGQSEFNVVYAVTRVDPGIPDPVLTEEGRHQIRAAAARLDGAGIRRIIASPYTRALQTAEIVADILGLPVMIDCAVRERTAFVCDIGSPVSVLTARFPRFDFSQIDERWWPDFESEDELAARCCAFHARMAAVPDWPEVAVITHWGFIRGLTGLRVGNGETLRFDPTGAAAVVHTPAP